MSDVAELRYIPPESMKLTLKVVDRLLIKKLSYVYNSVAESLPSTGSYSSSSNQV